MKYSILDLTIITSVEFINNLTHQSEWSKLCLLEDFNVSESQDDENKNSVYLKVYR